MAMKPGVVRPAIDGIAENGPATSRQVNTNLMTPAGDRTAAQEGAVAVVRDSFVLRDARRPVRRDSPRSTIGGIGAERLVDFAARGLDPAVDDGEIVFFRRRPYSLQPRVHGPALRKDDNA